MAKAEKPGENTLLRPSSVVVTDNDGVGRVLQAEKFDDLLWLYTMLKNNTNAHRGVKFYHCTGQELKVQLVVGFRYVGAQVKENVVFENPALEAIHSALFMET